MNKLPEKAVYSDVVNAGFILPYKRKYTMYDFKKLVRKGWSQVDARWIILCSEVYYHYEVKEVSITKEIETGIFLDLCKNGTAI